VSASPHGTDGHDSEARPTDDPADHDKDLTAEASAPGATTVVESRQAPDLPAEPPAPGGNPVARRRIRDEIGARSRLIAVLLTVSFLYIVADIFVKGPLTLLDIYVHNWDGQTEIPSLDRAAWVYDKMGQRSVLVPILLVVAGYFARRHRTWRPVVLASMSFLVLNVVVGAIKLLTGRAQTETGSPDVLTGGIIFPSGHSSNMVLTGGVIVYLCLRYGRNAPVRRADDADLPDQPLHRQPLAVGSDRGRTDRRAAAAVGDPLRHRYQGRPLHAAVVVAPTRRATAVPRDGSRPS
jgi:hypothetical protein